MIMNQFEPIDFAKSRMISVVINAYFQVSPFNRRVEDQLMRRFSHSRSGEGNTYNLQVGNIFNFYFDQARPPSNTARAISGIPDSHLDPGSYTSTSRDDDRSSERWSMSRDDDRSSERWSMSRDDDLSERWFMSRDDDRSERLSMSRDDDRSSERLSMTRDDDSSERSNSRTRRESEVATSQNDDSKCKVCLDNTADCVILRCGHFVCDSCGQRLKSNDSLCHICRQPIQDIIKTYRS
ncbi:uncharacterized protein LOC144618312 [Crassostrea virginica]